MRQHEKAAVKVGIVIDVEIPATADDEGLGDGASVLRSGDVAEMVVWPVRIDLRAFSPGQIAHVKPPYCSGAV